MIIDRSEYRHYVYIFEISWQGLVTLASTPFVPNYTFDRHVWTRNNLICFSLTSSMLNVRCWADGQQECWLMSMESFPGDTVKLSKIILWTTILTVFCLSWQHRVTVAFAYVYSTLFVNAGEWYGDPRQICRRFARCGRRPVTVCEEPRLLSRQWNPTLLLSLASNFWTAVSYSHADHSKLSGPVCL